MIFIGQNKNLDGLKTDTIEFRLVMLIKYGNNLKTPLSLPIASAQYFKGKHNGLWRVGCILRFGFLVAVP